MPEYGVTEKGFKRKSYEDILENQKEKARSLFGDDVNLDHSSPLGKLIRNFSLESAQNWSTLEDVYNASFLDYTNGASLDYLCKLIGISRRPANPARSSQSQIFEGDNGTVIPSGFLVETEERIRYITTESGVIENGTAEVDIEAVEPGASGNVNTNTITVIVNPISGLDSTYNPASTVDGRDVESDYQLRERFRNSLATGGGSTIDAIRAELLQLGGVIDAVVNQNNTMNDAYDLLDQMETEYQNENYQNMYDLIPDVRNAIADAKSIKSTIFGGVDQEIAEILFENVAAGIQTLGDITIDIEDDRGNLQPISFSRQNFVEVYVNATLTTNSEFPADGNTQVETEIIKYIGGIDQNNDSFDGLTLGEDVIRTRIIAAIHNVDGIVDVDLTIGESDTTLDYTNITIGEQSAATTDTTKVVVV